MVRTGKRVEVLRDLLLAAGLRLATTVPPRPTGDGHAAELLDLYRALAGLQADPSFKPGSWDLVFDGPLVVELDEELHFNRYRARTLESSWSGRLPWREIYLEQCERYEPNCLAAGSWGKRWTNASCARMFSGGPAGDLCGDGAPRWKQRALYDAIKDIGSTDGSGVSMARLSVHDEISGTTLGAALEQRASVSPKGVEELLEQRLAT
jgi:hypothetical protein